MSSGISFLSLADKKLAYQQNRLAGAAAPQKPGVLFLGGYGSDMAGTKASFLAARAEAGDYACLRFDYRGHGQSSGRFIDGTIGLWLQDALDIFDRLTDGPQILAGSSMGGWIGLLLAKARPERVAGFVGIAAAPDFTETLVWPNLTAKQRAELERDGVTYDENAPPDFRLPMTMRLIEEARNHLLLKAPLPLAIPVHLLQGQQDAEVPWRQALTLAETITGTDIRVTLVKDGNHRLSRPQDLALLHAAIGSMMSPP